MIIIISMCIGYVLGIAPFFVLRRVEKKDRVEDAKESKKENDETESILNEWINGKTIKADNTAKNTFNEYVTGEVINE